MQLTPELLDTLRRSASDSGNGPAAALWLIEQHGLLPRLAEHRCIVRETASNPSDSSFTAWVLHAKALYVLHRELSPEDTLVIGIASSLAGEIQMELADVDRLTDEATVRRVLYATAWAALGRPFADTLDLLDPDTAARYRRRALQWGAAEMLVERARRHGNTSLDTDEVAEALGLDEDEHPEPDVDGAGRTWQEHHPARHGRSVPRSVGAGHGPGDLSTREGFDAE
jgi:hypothetical protein